MVKCSYCEDPEIEKRTIIKNEYVWAFPSNIPIVPGHVLIVPNRCVAKYDDMSSDEISAIFDLASKLKPALAEVFGAEGFNYAWNEYEIAGQNVPHFHLHMLPRKEGDSGITEYEPRKFLYRPGSRETTPEQELISVAESIKKYLE